MDTLSNHVLSYVKEKEISGKWGIMRVPPFFLRDILKGEPNNVAAGRRKISTRIFALLCFLCVPVSHEWVGKGFFVCDSQKGKRGLRRKCKQGFWQAANSFLRG